MHAVTRTAAVIAYLVAAFALGYWLTEFLFT